MDTRTQEAVPQELKGPHLNAPVWPWVTAGWIAGAIFALTFLIAWMTRS